MKERPILFSAPMVRAILAGSKTQTRRVVKPQPIGTDATIIEIYGRGLPAAHPCPYGQHGDRLWARETFFDTEPYSAFPLFSDRKNRYIYRADGEQIGCHRWRPSIHMPRVASRILLEIVAVRVERLRDISREDAISEGVQPLDGSNGPNYWTVDAGGVSLNNPTAQGAYSMLWDWINGPGAWDKNPWVWVVEFRRVLP